MRNCWEVLSAKIPNVKNLADMQVKTSVGVSDSEVEVAMAIKEPMLLIGQRLVLFVNLHDANSPQKSLPFLFEHRPPPTSSVAFFVCLLVQFLAFIS